MLSICATLADGTSLNAKDRDGWNTLMNAAYYNSVNVTGVLLTTFCLQRKLEFVIVKRKRNLVLGRL